MRTLVWITNSFRLNSRLTNNLEGDCTFVYYSPYYFAGEREREILRKTSQKNLDAFYHSLHQFDSSLKTKGNQLYVFKQSNPIEHINALCKKYAFDRVIIDQPLFAMWHSINLLDLIIPYEIVDSALIDDTCFKMTAKSRWMSHVKLIDTESPLQWNSGITHLAITEPTQTYPIPQSVTPFIDTYSVLSRAKGIAPTYSQTRDAYNGQTQLSTIMQNGMVDPHNIFFSIAQEFKASGSDLSINEGPHASMLRQFAFREMNIIKARRNNLTMENTPLEWARVVMHPKALENLLDSKPNPNSTITLNSIKTSNTGIPELDLILQHFNPIGIMPNRARMYFAGKIFYESKTGLDALNLLIETFDLIGLDGQCPNNYLQCIDSLGLSYGKVMAFSKTRTFELLSYPEKPIQYTDKNLL